MSKIVLLHGFAVHLTAPVVRPPFGPSASMTAFDHLVSTGEARVFPWGIERKVSPVELLRPSVIQKLYKEELDLIHTDELQTNLKLFLEQEQPETIVCHSMGCELLQLHLENFNLPPSVKSIVVIQSDLPIGTSFRTSVPIHHLYCPWDPTLILSSVTNKSIRAGLLTHKQSNAKNVLFPLVRLSNLHTSSIRDKKLLAFINSLS